MNGFDSVRVRQRGLIAQWVVGLAFLVLIGAFFRTQIVQHEKFQLKAETNRLRPVPLTPPRGVIFDRKGKIIAENVPGYSVKLLAPAADSLTRVLQRFSEVVPLDSSDIQTIVRRYRQATYEPVTVLGDATFEQVSRLEEHRAVLPGLIVQSEPKRFYPAGKAVAHVVGYVSEVTEGDLASKRYAGAGLGTIVGKAGLEREYDDTLRGTPGVRYIEVNARGRLVREQTGVATLPPAAGKALHTTIDVDLQEFIDSIWPAGVRGAMVAVTPSGEVRALYSAPAYDPNLFVGGISSADWRALNDSTHPLIDRAINGRYPPASPFKLAIAAMALKRGLVDFNSHMPLPCTGGMRLGNRVFHCWKHDGGHGSLDLLGAIAASCDVYFYQLGLKLGLEAIVKDGNLMGFRDKSGIDLPSENDPIFPKTTAYFDARYGPRNWSPPATTLNFSIGQGENTQTVVNMVKFYEALAGNGIAVEPYIVPHKPDEPPRDLGLTAEQLAGIRQALTAVATRGTASIILRGTVSSSEAALTIAGKTGTAQNSHGLDHRWFIAMAPADHPQLVIGGMMENVGLHDPRIVRNTILALRRYVLGPTAASDTISVKALEQVGNTP